MVVGKEVTCEKVPCIIDLATLKTTIRAESHKMSQDKRLVIMIAL